MYELAQLLRQPTSTIPITPSDATVLSTASNGTIIGVTKGVLIGVGGTLVYRLFNDTADTTLPVQAGQYVPGVFLQVRAATTATSIVGLGG